MVKHLPAMWETWVQSLGREDPLDKGNGNPLQYPCLEKSHGRRNLVGDSPWGRKESAMTEHLPFFFLSLLVSETLLFLIIWFLNSLGDLAWHESLAHSLL